MRFYFLLWILLSGWFGPTLSAQDADPLGASLEKAYLGWRQAMIRSDFNQWRTQTPTSRQVSTRNLIVSQRKRFPEALFALPMRPPSLDGLSLLSARSKGATATAVYFGRIDFGTGNTVIPENLMVLRFINEGARWKYDTITMMSLDDSPEVRAEIRQGKLDFLNEPEFSPSGRVPPVAKRCDTPDYVTDIHIISLGYEVEATVNGMSQHQVTDDVATELVIGGLNAGENPLSLRIKRLANPARPERIFKITAHVKTGNPTNPAIKVFEFAPAEVPATLTTEIVVEDNLLGRQRR